MCRLTVAALTAESFLKARCSVHPRLAAGHHDLVGVGFGTGEGGQSYSTISEACSPSRGSVLLPYRKVLEVFTASHHNTSIIPHGFIS